MAESRPLNSEKGNFVLKCRKLEEGAFFLEERIADRFEKYQAGIEFADLQRFESGGNKDLVIMNYNNRKVGYAGA